MKSSGRLIAKTAFLLVVGVVFLGGLALAWFTSWRSDRLADLEGASEVAETSAGPVEYLIGGEGPTVLVFHGAPGGYDQAMLLGANLRDNGFQVIAFSRPGFLRTPLATGLLPEQQADAAAALLDTLGVEGTAVLGFSEGAPAAVQFALRHPQRIAALALLSPVTKRFHPGAKDAGSEFARDILNGLTGDIGSWVAGEMAARDPARSVDWLLEQTSLLDPMARTTTAHVIAANSAQRDWFQSFLGTFAPLTPREAGTRNDLVQNRALEIPFAKIQTPTLLVHGTQDRNVPVEDSIAVAAQIPGATLFRVPETGHIVQLGTRRTEVEEKVKEFFRAHTGGQSAP